MYFFFLIRPRPEKSSGHHIPFYMGAPGEGGAEAVNTFLPFTFFTTASMMSPLKVMTETAN